MKELRGISVEGNSVYFTVADVPIVLKTSEVGLLNRLNSPIILRKTIMRRNDSLPYCEGDLVFQDDEHIGYAIYSVGFHLLTISGELKPMPVGEHIKMKDGTKESCNIVYDSEHRYPLKYASANWVTPIESIVGIKDNCLMLKNRNRVVPPDEFRMASGMNAPDGSPLAFGVVVNGGRLGIHGHDLAVMDMFDGQFLKYYK